ncbi:MAG: CBS domain-containing protein [Solobacterium sp.]|nr:CBS domain-containing protein [Solobacterium sp.]
MKRKIEDFRKLCTKFETIMRNGKYHLLGPNDSVWYEFSHDREFRQYRDSIQTIRVIRNSISHYNYDWKNSPADEEGITISDIAFDKLEEIINYVNNPPTVESIYKKRAELFTAKKDDSVKNVIEEMRKRGITHVPILDSKGKLSGVFSENTIFSKLCDEEILGIDENETLDTYEKYLPIESHESEYFSFVSRHEKLFNVVEMFNNYIKGDKKLVLIFVTEDGKESQSILGIISPWDVIKV